MSLQHAVVWLDHHRAVVIDFSRDAEHVHIVPSNTEQRQIHRRSGGTGQKVAEDRHFFDDIVAAIGDAREILIVGPGSAKTEFRKDLDKHHAAVAARVVGVEAAGGSAIGGGQPGVLHGMRSMLIQSEDGQIEEAHSISAGLDYPGIGPEHAHLASIGRAEYVSATDEEVLDALQMLSKYEGIIPALETAHALAYVIRAAGREIPRGASVLVNLSGRGDKDVAQVRDVLRGNA